MNKLDLTPRDRFSERDLEYEFLFGCLRDIRGRSILDVGSGRTGLHLMLIACGYIPTSVDTNPVARWVDRGDIQNLQYKSSSFDCVLCVSTLEHTKSPTEGTTEMLRVLKHGGSLVISFPYNQHDHINNVAPSGRLTAVFNQGDIDNWFGGLHLVRRQYWRQWTGKCWRDGEVEIKAHETTQDLSQGISLHFIK